MASCKGEYVLRIFPGHIMPSVQSTVVPVWEDTTAEEAVQVALDNLNIKDSPKNFELVEVAGYDKSHVDERVISGNDLCILGSRNNQVNMRAGKTSYRFFLKEKLNSDNEELAPKSLELHWMETDQNVKDRLDLDFDFDSRLPDDDLCCLSDLSEETLLDHLQKRFKKQRVYTYVGEILIAVNPYKYFPIYNPKYINAYQNKRFGKLSPHIFAVADEAFQRMLREKVNACVVISGESGSGKTESTKLLLHHLMALSHKTQETWLEQTILGAGPVLEAFGNAKTVHNNNSSRFGKFIQIKYREDGVVRGALLRQYLLEKSRLILQSKQERNYHVFYYLLSGLDPEEREEIHLKNAEDYYYLNQSHCYALDGIDEVYEFFRLKQSMEMIGFSSETQTKIFRILSAVLNIGNLEFRKRPGHEDAVAIKDTGVLEIIAELLMVTKELLTNVLTKRKSKLKGDQFVVAYKHDEAVSTKDALAKALYGSLFDWLVLQVNHTIVTKRSKAASSYKGNSISVLDIFGFENFGRNNSFEQFCINYANEKLQHYFNQHIFRMEQDEYLAEGINWENVDFVDNTSCLALIVGRPTGLFCLVDEESSLHAGTDTSLLGKINFSHINNDYYEPVLIRPAFMILHYAGRVEYNIKGFRSKNRDLLRPDILTVLKSSNMRFVRELIGGDPLAAYRWAILRTTILATAAFKVAGRRFRARGGRRLTNRSSSERSTKGSTKSYSSRGKAMANGHESDPSEFDDSSLIRKASKVLKKMQNVKNTVNVKPQLAKIRQGLESKKEVAGKMVDYISRGFHHGSTSPGSVKSSVGPKNPPSVGQQFQVSLNKLMETLSEAHPFFVRCIRSNATKAPLKFDSELVVRQLRYTGMLETVRIRRSGFRFRYIFEEFFRNYRVLFPDGGFPPENLPEYLNTLGLDSNGYQIGKTKIFLQETQHKILQDKLLEVITCKACILQQWMRARLQRRHFLQVRNAAISIQAVYRGYRVRQQLHNLRLRWWAATKIQSEWRKFVAEKHYLQLQDPALLDQCMARGYMTRKSYQRILSHLKPSRKLRPVDEELFADGEEPLGKNQNRSLSSHSVLLKKTLGEPITEVSEMIRQRRRRRVCPVPEEVEQTKMPEDQSQMNGYPDWCSASNASTCSSPEPSKYVDTSSDDLSETTDERSEDEILEVPRRLSLPKSFSRPTSLPSTSSAGQHSPPPPQRQHSDSCLQQPSLNSEETPDETVTCDALTRHMSSRLKKKLSFRGKQRKDSNAQELSSTSSTSEPTTPVEPTLNKLGPLSLSLLDLTHLRAKKPNLFRKRSSKDSTTSHGSHKIDFHCFPNHSERTRMSEDYGHGMIVGFVHPKVVSPVTSGAIIPGTLQWKATGNRIIKGSRELAEMDMFLVSKMSVLNKETAKRDTIVDHVFKKSLQEFHTNLISTYSVVMKHDDSVCLKYEDLISNFENILNNIIKIERISARFPITMGINAFSGVLDEFLITRKPIKESKSIRIQRKPTHKKRKSSSNNVEYLGHSYHPTQFSIPTFCEYCNSLIWVLEKGMVCQICKYTCHKKCYPKATVNCRHSRTNSIQGDVKTCFGVELAQLVSDKHQIPVVVEKLIQDIETRGLYMEGIYRKSPSIVAVKSLRNSMSSKDFSNVNFEDYPVHVVAGVLKLFFRQLNSPLISGDFYQDFLRATALSNAEIRLQTLYELVQQLPKPHYDTLERLIYHLARLSRQEESNKMSCNGLAIIWAPCIIRPPENVGALESLEDVRKMTRCLELLIKGQAEKIKNTLSDIRVLERAISSANLRLTEIKTKSEEKRPCENEDETDVGGDEETTILKTQINNLEEQKADLTATMYSLEHRAGKTGSEASDEGFSDEDNDLYCSKYEEYAVTFDLPATPAQLKHLTKHRPTPRKRNLPSRKMLSRSNSNTGAR